MVTNFDRNGKIIPDMSQIVLRAEDYPAIKTAILTMKGKQNDTVRN